MESSSETCRLEISLRRVCWCTPGCLENSLRSARSRGSWPCWVSCSGCAWGLVVGGATLGHQKPIKSVAKLRVFVFFTSASKSYGHCYYHAFASRNVVHSISHLQLHPIKFRSMSAFAKSFRSVIRFQMMAYPQLMKF